MSRQTHTAHKNGMSDLPWTPPHQTTTASVDRLTAHPAASACHDSPRKEPLQWQGAVCGCFMLRLAPHTEIPFSQQTQHTNTRCKQLYVYMGCTHTVQTHHQTTTTTRPFKPSTSGQYRLTGTLLSICVHVCMDRHITRNPSLPSPTPLFYTVQ